MINPEYNLKDNCHYVPEHGEVYSDLTDIEILAKKHSDQGVSVYEKGILIADIVGESTNNDMLTVHKEDDTVFISLDDEKIMPRVYEGEGITIGKEPETNKATISIDKKYIRKVTKLKGRRGIIVTENPDASKWVEIDDHYIDDGHSWDNPFFSDADY